MAHEAAVSRRILVFAIFTLAIATFVPGAVAEPTAERNSSVDVTPAVDPAASESTTKHDLRYKFATGDVLRYEVQHRASVRSTIDEVTQSAQTKTDSTKLWKVTDVLPNGDIEVMNVVERVHMVNQLPDRAPTEYDSAKDASPPPGFEDAAKAIGIPLSVVRMTPRGKVIERKVKHRTPGSEEDGAGIVRLPDRPVTVNTTWDEPLEVTVQLEGGGTKVIETRRHFKLASVSAGIATIEVTYQVLSSINSYIESQLVQRLMSGRVRFDFAEGRIVGQEMEVDKRILGFAGPTSSMQYIMRMEERLVAEPAKVAVKASDKPETSKAPAEEAVIPIPEAPYAPNRSASSAGPSKPESSRPTRTSARPRKPLPTKGYRR